MSGYFPGFSIESTVRSMSNSGQYRWWGCGRSSFKTESTEALRNQGKSSNGMKSSRSSTSTQTPCREMLVTSAAEVLIRSLCTGARPCVANFKSRFFAPMWVGMLSCSNRPLIVCRRFAACHFIVPLFLGLTPQAKCLSPLRGLTDGGLLYSWGSRPRL